MIKRISLWKLTDSTKASEMKDKLLSMRGKVPGLSSIEVGVNESTHDSAYDIVFIGTFADKATLEAFEAHPFHRSIGEYVSGIKTDRKVIEYTL